LQPPNRPAHSCDATLFTTIVASTAGAAAHSHRSTSPVAAAPINDIVQKSHSWLVIIGTTSRRAEITVRLV